MSLLSLFSEFALRLRSSRRTGEQSRSLKIVFHIYHINLPLCSLEASYRAVCALGGRVGRGFGGGRGPVIFQKRVPLVRILPSRCITLCMRPYEGKSSPATRRQFIACQPISPRSKDRRKHQRFVFIMQYKSRGAQLEGKCNTKLYSTSGLMHIARNVFIRKIYGRSGPALAFSCFSFFSCQAVTCEPSNFSPHSMFLAQGWSGYVGFI